MKSAARNKLVHVIEDAFRQGTDDIRGHLDRLERAVEDQSALLEQIRVQTARHEHQARHDVAFAADVEAAAQSAEFVEEFMPRAIPLGSALETMAYALGEVRITGMALEFGVAAGDSLRRIASALGTKQEVTLIAGFDSFEGLPETWRQGFEKGMFAQKDIPSVDGAQVVPGLFRDTLPKFLGKHRGPISFLHLDADLYSSTAEVLAAVGPRLRAGSIVVFDDFLNYPGWRDHEHRAWKEFAGRTKTTFDFLAYTTDHQQVVARVG